ncbi:MAG: hypothetical protein ABI862_14365, partial [Ilumatobacteraceae bacterium]
MASVSTTIRPVAQSKRVSIPQLRESLATLERVGAPLLGIVMTRAKVDSIVTDEYEYGPSTTKATAVASALMDVTNLLVVRHGQSEWNAIG